jgi:hypothetical protein
LESGRNVLLESSRNVLLGIAFTFGVGAVLVGTILRVGEKPNEEEDRDEQNNHGGDDCNSFGSIILK